MNIHATNKDKNLWFNTAHSYILAKLRNPDMRLVSFSKSEYFRCVDHKAIYESLRKLDSSKLSSYYADQYGHTVFNAFVLRLNHGRGFLAGFYLEDSDWYTVDYGCIYANNGDAIISANRLALQAAEDEQQYQIKQRAIEIIDELKNDLKTERADTLAALKGAPRKAREKLVKNWLEWKADRYQGIKELTDKPYMSTEWSN